MNFEPLTIERLKYWLRYDRNSGLFIRRRDVPQSRFKKGDIAGTTNKRGYVIIKIDGRLYKAHRLAWFYVYGVWPTKNIDHEDGNTSNNRIRNLRDACQAINNHNRRGANKNNASGLLGVRRTKRDTFVAGICVDGRYIYLGTHKQADKAHAAYLSAKRELHAGNTL